MTGKKYLVIFSMVLISLGLVVVGVMARGKSSQASGSSNAAEAVEGVMDDSSGETSHSEQGLGEETAQEGRLTESADEDRYTETSTGDGDFQVGDNTRGGSGRPAVSDADEDMDLLYHPTPQVVVNKMLEMARIKKGDVVYDLGCGDGRFVITAAQKYKVRGVGIDLNPERVEDSLRNVKKAGVEKLVSIHKGNVLRWDLREATVVTTYLFPEVMARLEPILLKQLKPGSRVVSHEFEMVDWQPVKKHTVKYKGESYNILLYIVPERKPAKKKPARAK